ncbi:LOW QUALITY PROTEIN: Autism susceptibility gene 2 protein, partial [Galemys pyrenaicus]
SLLTRASELCRGIKPGTWTLILCDQASDKSSDKHFETVIVNKGPELGVSVHGDRESQGVGLVVLRIFDLERSPTATIPALGRIPSFLDPDMPLSAYNSSSLNLNSFSGSRSNIPAKTQPCSSLHALASWASSFPLLLTTVFLFNFSPPESPLHTNIIPVLCSSHCFASTITDMRESSADCVASLQPPHYMGTRFHQHQHQHVTLVHFQVVPLLSGHCQHPLCSFIPAVSSIPTIIPPTVHYKEHFSLRHKIPYVIAQPGIVPHTAPKVPVSLEPSTTPMNLHSLPLCFLPQMLHVYMGSFLITATSSTLLLTESLLISLSVIGGSVFRGLGKPSVTPNSLFSHKDGPNMQNFSTPSRKLEPLLSNPSTWLKPGDLECSVSAADCDRDVANKDDKERENTEKRHFSHPLQALILLAQTTIVESAKHNSTSSLKAEQCKNEPAYENSKSSEVKMKEELREDYSLFPEALARGLDLCAHDDGSDRHHLMNSISSLDRTHKMTPFMSINSILSREQFPSPSFHWDPFENLIFIDLQDKGFLLRNDSPPSFDSPAEDDCCFRDRKPHDTTTTTLCMEGTRVLFPSTMAGHQNRFFNNTPQQQPLSVLYQLISTLINEYSSVSRDMVEASFLHTKEYGYSIRKK